MMSFVDKSLYNARKALELNPLRSINTQIGLGGVASVSKMLEDNSGLNLVHAPMQLNGNGTTVLDIWNFKDGSIRIFSIGFIVASVTDSSSCTNVYFNLYDGTNNVSITKTNGADITGITVGGLGIKLFSAGTALSILNCDQVGAIEPAGSKIAQDTIITPKAGVDNKIQIIYTGSDGFDITIVPYVTYQFLGFSTIENV